MSRPRVAIRVDGSRSIGSGHVVRCMTLANDLRSRGATLFFVMREGIGHLAHLVSAAGYEVKLLPQPPEASGTRDHPWGGVSEEQDASETLAAVGAATVDWLVVDQYGLGAEWECLVRTAARKILVIDDRDDRSHDCDILVDQNYFGSETDARYQSKVPNPCRRLLGPRYALLQPEYAHLRRVVTPRDHVMRRVLVFFGGSDPLNQTARVIDALSAASLAHLSVDVVVGVNHPDKKEIVTAVARRPDTRVHAGLPSLAGLMVGADAFVGGGGGTTWERAALMLPGLVSADAANHEGFSVRLHEEKFQIYLGRGENIPTELWRQQIESLASDAALLGSLSRRIGSLTDGMGTPRVIRAMLGNESATLRVRRDESLKPVQDRGGMDVHASESPTILVGSDEAGLILGSVRLDVDGETGDVVVEACIDAGVGDPVLSHKLTREAIDFWLRSQRERADADSTIPRGFFRLGQSASEPLHKLRISILSDEDTWLNPAIELLERRFLSAGHHVRWVHAPAELERGDVCFILGVSRMLTSDHLARSRHNLVVHEDALPKGRGWSPMTWQILEGESRITVTLFEATSDVDAGPIYLQETIALEGHELVDEWRSVQAETTCALCARWVDSYPAILGTARPQSGKGTYYERRRPHDSRLDPHKTIAEQFNLLRVVDNERYPAFVDLHGKRYTLMIEQRLIEQKLRREGG